MLKQRVFCVVVDISNQCVPAGMEAIGDCAAVYLPHHFVGEAAPMVSSPGICYLCGLLHASPVGTKIVLRGREVTATR